MFDQKYITYRKESERRSSISRCSHTLTFNPIPNTTQIRYLPISLGCSNIYDDIESSRREKKRRAERLSRFDWRMRMAANDGLQIAMSGL